MPGGVNHGRILVLTKIAVSWIVAPSFIFGGSLTLIEAGSVLCLSARITFIMPAHPATDLRWPMFDLTEPTATRSRCCPHSDSRAGPSPTTFLSAVSSIASPTGVPVPWPSTIVTVDGQMPAAAYARRIAISWPAIVGA